MPHLKTTWISDPAGFESTTIGRVTVIVWTGSPADDLDQGCEVCEAYIPTTDRELPDGLMLVGRRRLPTWDRAVAREMALDAARREIIIRAVR